PRKRKQSKAVEAPRASRFQERRARSKRLIRSRCVRSVMALLEGQKSQVFWKMSALHKLSGFIRRVNIPPRRLRPSFPGLKLPSFLQHCLDPRAERLSGGVPEGMATPKDTPVRANQNGMRHAAYNKGTSGWRIEIGTSTLSSPVMLQPIPT